MYLIHRLSKIRNAKWLVHLVGLAMTIAMGLPFYLLSYRGNQQLTAANREQSRELALSLNDVGQLRARYRQLSKARDQARAAVDQKLAIPVGTNDSEFVAAVSRIADELEIAVSDYRRGELRRSKPYSQLSVTVNFSASHVAICNFFDRIAELPFVVQVCHLKIESRNLTTNVYPVSVDFVLVFQEESLRTPLTGNDLASADRRTK